MIRALVTRPAEDAAEITRELESRGIVVVNEPMLAIRPREGVAVDTSGVQALLFTSANGVRAFAKLASVRDLPAFAVGDATATALRGLGFTKVESAGGDVEDLERLVRQKLDPQRGKLLHAAGTSVAGDLAGRLAAAGFTVDRLQLYDSEPATELGPLARLSLSGGKIDWVLVFSPRTGAAFASVMTRAGLVETARKMTLVALSDAVAKATALPFHRVAVAAKPSQAALLATVDELIAPKTPMSDPKTQPSSPSSSSPPARHPLLPMLIAAAVVVGIIVGVVVMSQQRSDPTPAATPVATTSAPAAAVPAATVPIAAPVDVAPLTQRLDKLDAAMAGLPQRLDGVANDAKQAGAKAGAAADAAAARPETPPVDLGPIEKRIGDLEKSLAEAMQRMTAAAAETDKRLGEMERLAKSDRRIETAALASLRVGDALAAGRPYKSELALLAGMADIEAEVKILAARAETGIPSRATLIERFPAAASAASRDADRGDDFWSQAVAKLKGLVSIRRLAPGDDLDGRLARAELALKNGDLAAAVAALQSLPEGANRALASWRADAEARLAAERALDRMTQALAAGLSRAG